MDARLQRRIQRYGWDLAALDYESLWQAQLAEAQVALLASVSPAVGERVLDIACGTGLVSFEAARAVGPRGACAWHRLIRTNGRCRRTASEGPGVIELRLFTHGCRDASSAKRQLRCRLVRSWAHVHAGSRTGVAGDEQGIASRRSRSSRGMGRTLKLRMVGIVSNRQCRGHERGVPVILSSRAPRHPRKFMCR
jgi:hypothetical protein